MVGLLKIEGLSNNVTVTDIRRYFKENGSKAENVHLSKNQRDAVAFLIFTEPRELDIGLQADGSLFRNQRLTVRKSNPTEFNRFFPGIAMLNNQRENRSTFNKQENLIVKVEGLDAEISIGEIRKYFTEKGTHPSDIRVSSGKGRNYDGFAVAFLFYQNRRDAENALRTDGAFFRNQRIVIKASNQFELDQHFSEAPPKITPAAKVDSTRKKTPSVIKVYGIEVSTNQGDIRRYFKENGARPDDIHLISGQNGQHNGSAFLIFTDRRNMEIALQADGTYFREKKLSVRPSHPKEFNRFFPSVDMLSSKSNILPDGFGQSRNQRGNNRDNNIATRNNNRDRSRSPLRNGKDQPSQQQFFQNFDGPPPNVNSDPLADVDMEKFVRMSGLPYDTSATQIVNYFQPIPIREIFILKHPSGKFRGQTDGSAVIEFFAKNTARRAVQEWDGRFISQRLVNVRIASKEDVCRALQISYPTEQPPPSSFPGPPSLNNVPGGNNTQMQSLLNLLTATVTAMANQQPQQQQPPLPSFSDQQLRPPGADDSVISRVATSANINVNDIHRGCVVGLRNLPYSVTPEEIMQFFEGFHPIPSSIRIHFLDSGRCSGDAIVSFHNNRDARNAVKSLNKKKIGPRRVDLFFL